MPVNTDLLNSIISGLNSLPKKSEIDTIDNDIDLLATETTHGLMSYTDKSKLNKIDESANNYTLPMASYDVLGGIKSGIQKTDSTGLEPIPIIDGIPYYKPYELPIASSNTLGGIKAGDGVDISSDGTLTIKSVDSGNFEGILAIEKGGTGAENKVDARKKINTIPYVVCGNITLTDETNSGYYHAFSLNQYSNNTICLKILINSKISEPTMFDLILASDDSTKSKPIVKLYEATRSNVSNLLNMLYVVQTDTESSGEIQLWYKNTVANTPIKITIIQVSSLYSNDEHDIVSLSSIPNTAVDVMGTTLNNVYILKNCIISSEATNSEPGYLSVADKIKLDGIDSVLSGKANSSHIHTISDISDFPTSMPANGGNANTLNNLTDGYWLGTLDINGGGHGAAHRLQCQYSKFGDGRFGFKIESGHEVRCDYATNADTLDGLHADEFVEALTNVQITNTRILIPNDADVVDWLQKNAKIGNLCYRTNYSMGQTNLPPLTGNNWAWFSFDGNRFLARVMTSDYTTRDFLLDYVNLNGGWKEISTTPIKKMTFPSVSTNAGGGGLLFSADFGTPITIACTSRADTQCTPFFAANQWLVLAKDAATLDPIPAGSYSFEVWYI